MIDILISLGIVLVIAYFWRLRQMAEHCQQFAIQQCKSNHLQFIAIGLTQAKPTCTRQAGLTWATQYSLEFSTNGYDHHRAKIFMQGSVITKIIWPINLNQA